jgi:hypothetical protein
MIMDNLPWFTKSDIVALCVSLSALCLMGLWHLVKHVIRRLQR